MYQESSQECKFFLCQRSALWETLLLGWGAQTAGKKDTKRECKTYVTKTLRTAFGAEVYLVAKSGDRDPSDGDGTLGNICFELRSISQLWT